MDRSVEDAYPELWERPQIPSAFSEDHLWKTSESLCLMLYSMAGAHSARLQGKLGALGSQRPRSSLQSVMGWRESWQINSPPSTCQDNFEFSILPPRVPHGTELPAPGRLWDLGPPARIAASIESSSALWKPVFHNPLGDSLFMVTSL